MISDISEYRVTFPNQNHCRQKKNEYPFRMSWLIIKHYTNLFEADICHF